MRTSHILARVAAVVAAPVLALTAAAPASATSVGATANCGYGQTCTGFAQDVVGVGSGADVEVACSAATPYVVQATVVQCYIVGNTGDVHYTGAILTQGESSSLTYDFPAWSLTSRAYAVCVGAGYFNGSYFPPTNFKCMTSFAVDA